MHLSAGLGWVRARGVNLLHPGHPQPGGKGMAIPQRCPPPSLPLVLTASKA